MAEATAISVSDRPKIGRAGGRRPGWDAAEPERHSEGARKGDGRLAAARDALGEAQHWACAGTGPLAKHAST